MKKYLIYPLFAAASFMMASCNEDFNENIAAPQQWEQEAAITLSGFSATGVTNLDLGSITTDSVNLCSLTTPTGIPEGAILENFRINLSQADAENTAVTISADSNGNVATKDLQAAIEAIYGKRPTLRSFNAEVLANMTINGQASLLSTTTTVTATPKAPFISTGYYLVGDMFKIDEANNGWNDVCMQPFSHSGKDVYEDPIFTIEFTTTGADQYWKIIPQINIDNNDFWANQPGVVGPAVDGESSLTGTLVNMLANAGKIEEEGMYRMTLNMMDYSYKVEILNHQEFIYEIGNNNGWSTTYALHSPASDGIYHGAMFLKSGFKFRSNANDWNGSGNWGLDADGTEGKLISDGGSKDIPLTEDGFYKITVDLNKMEYTLAKFEKLGIIGDGQPGGWDTDTELTYDDTEKCWKATGVELTGGKSIKFRTVGDWNTVNIGGASLDKLIFNSNDNIPVAESGTFTVKLFLETAGQPYATLTKE